MSHICFYFWRSHLLFFASFLHEQNIIFPAFLWDFRSEEFRDSVRYIQASSLQKLQTLYNYQRFLSLIGESSPLSMPFGPKTMHGWLVELFLLARRFSFLFGPSNGICRTNDNITKCVADVRRCSVRIYASFWEMEPIIVS